MCFSYFLCALVLHNDLVYGDDGEQPNWNSTTLGGDWNGARSTLFDKGVNLGFVHKSDLLANTSGGIEQGAAWVGHTDVTANLDMEKLLQWTDSTAYFHYHSNLGSKFNSYYTGSFMGVDNIEVGSNTAQFFHAWLQKSFLDGKFSVLAGLYPVDSEFYVTDSSGLFLHPSFGVDPVIAQTGTNGPSVFPTSSFGIRFKFTSPDKTFYMMASINDAVPIVDPNFRTVN